MNRKTKYAILKRVKCISKKSGCSFLPKLCVLILFNRSRYKFVRAVRKRSGGRCGLCGEKIHGNGQIHHIYPQSTHRYLKFYPWNGVLVHSGCHWICDQMNLIAIRDDEDTVHEFNKIGNEQRDRNRTLKRQIAPQCQPA